MKPAQLNLNDYVTVQLTDHGVEILRQKHQERELKLKSSLRDYADFVPPENNMLTIQMWELMQTFGEHMGMGMKLPFGLWISAHKANCKEGIKV